MLAFHDADTDTDTDSPNTATILRPTHTITCAGRKIVAVFGKSVLVSVSVSVSWNASFTPRRFALEREVYSPTETGN